MADVKQRKAKSKAKRRLKNVVVDEISFVDSPAVPDAKFVIAKRDEEDEVQVEDFVTAASDELQKAYSLEQEMERRKGYMTTELLHMTARAIGQLLSVKDFIAGDGVDTETIALVTALLEKHGVTIGVAVEKSDSDDSERTNDELLKRLDALESRLNKSTEPTQLETAETETSESVVGGAGDDTVPAGSSVEKSLFESLDDEWKARQSALEKARLAREADEDAKQGDRLLKMLDSIAGKITATDERIEALSTRVDRAAGKCD